jgi:hypothetical protein
VTVLLTSDEKFVIVFEEKGPLGSVEYRSSRFRLDSETNIAENEKKRSVNECIEEGRERKLPTHSPLV